MFFNRIRYCLDSYVDEFDWRRKAMEACFECFLPNNHLMKVCLSCARNCLSRFRLRPYIRHRDRGDTCDCRLYSNMCVSIWSPVRQKFDDICAEDKCIGPNQIRGLLKALRHPYPIENADVEDALSLIAEGAAEDDELPRIKPVPFERWYRKYFDEPYELDVAANGEVAVAPNQPAAKKKSSEWDDSSTVFSKQTQGTSNTTIATEATTKKTK
jgi:hypothetical protein